MGKAKYGSKELTREQRLINENKKLKREIGSLRKQLARVDLDKYSQVREMIEEHYQEDRKQEGKDILEGLKKVWECKKCHSGFLEIFIFNKMGEPWYYRSCCSQGCSNRTKSQKYDPGKVKGIVRKTEE